MGDVLLDTTVLIDVLRGRGGALERLAGVRRLGDRPHTCAVTVEEVTRGLHAEEGEAAERLFNGLRIVPLGAVEGLTAGAWRRTFASRGVTLAQADCLVAAAASTIGGRLATGNPRHFPMDGLTVEHWPVGE